MRIRAMAVLGLLVLTGTAGAQTPPVTPAGPPPADAFLDLTTVRLWEEDAPGALGKGPADVPSVTVFRPQPGSGNGTAVIIAPGGAYLNLASNLEGRQVADWFNARGVTAFVLRYRLGRSYLYPVPLTDAQRAIRLVRARAAEFAVAPDRIGMMGFSAGGHLTASAGTMFSAGQPGSSDPVERVSSRPDFLILAYPWLNAMKPGQRPGVLTYYSALNIAPGRRQAFEQYSPDQHVTAQTPPAFLYHTSDDETVPVEASVTFYQALRAAGVPAEMHVFAHGRHGTGLGLGDLALDLWPLLLEAWLRGRGLLTPAPGVPVAGRLAPAPATLRRPGAPFSVDQPVGELLANADVKAVLSRDLEAEFVNYLPAAHRGCAAPVRGSERLRSDCVRALMTF